MDRSVAELRKKVDDVFHAPGPGWEAACYQSPDLMIEAPDAETVRRGDHRFVMGELHVGVNTLGNTFFVDLHPESDDLSETIRKDLPEPRVVLRSFLLVTSMVNFFAMPVILLLPFYVNQTLGRDAAWYGFLLAAMGAGSLVGYVLAGTWKVRPEHRPWIVLSVLGLVAVAFTGLGASQAPVLALGLFFAVGMGTGLINIFLMTLFQVASPREMRGRVMALVLALSGAASPLGMALGGVLGDATGKNIPALYAGCGLAIGGMAVLAALSRSFRDFLSYDDNQDEEGREHAI